VLGCHHNPLKNAFEETNKEANKNGTVFANLTKMPHILCNEIINTCAEDESPKFLFPTYGLVIDGTQVFCGGFFHWMIESEQHICSNFILSQYPAPSLTMLA
jgi:hypothetical protein